MEEACEGSILLEVGHQALDFASTQKSPKFFTPIREDVKRAIRLFEQSYGVKLARALLKGDPTLRAEGHKAQLHRREGKEAHRS